MKKIFAAGGGIAAVALLPVVGLLVVLLFFGSVIPGMLGGVGVLGTSLQSQDNKNKCDTTNGIVGTAGSNVPLQGSQQDHVRTAIGVGKSMGMSEEAWVRLVMTWMQESGLKNLASRGTGNTSWNNDWGTKGKEYWMGAARLSVEMPNDGISPGDMDSVGLGQFRIMNGAGDLATPPRKKYGATDNGMLTDPKKTVQRLMNPSWAAMAFYGGDKSLSTFPGLADVNGWESMPATQAIQKVQGSAFGGAYAKWEAQARALVAANKDAPAIPVGDPLANGTAAAPAPAPAPAPGGGDDLSTAPSAVVANNPGQPAGGSAQGDAQGAIQRYNLGPVKPHVASAADVIGKKFAIQTIGGYRAGDAIEPAGHPAGLAIDVMTFTDMGKGQQVADWVKANAESMGVLYIIWNQQIWNTQRASEGWRPMEDRGSVTQNHKDHVHISFKEVPGSGTALTEGGSGTAQAPECIGSGGGADMGGSVAAGPGGLAAPLKPGSYTMGAQWGAVGSWARYHTGADLAAPMGTPVYATGDGTIVDASPGTQGWAGSKYSVVRMNDGSSALYAHLSVKSVPTGGQVKAGQQIGLVGQEGRAFGAHLHFEYYPPGVQPGIIYSSADPVKWMTAAGVKL